MQCSLFLVLVCLLYHKSLWIGWHSCQPDVVGLQSVDFTNLGELKPSSVSEVPC